MKNNKTRPVVCFGSYTRSIDAGKLRLPRMFWGGEPKYWVVSVKRRMGTVELLPGKAGNPGIVLKARSQKRLMLGRFLREAGIRSEQVEVRASKSGDRVILREVRKR